MFPDAYIDENNGYLLFPNDEKDSSEIKICPNCGAGVEVIMGYSGKCSYCGQIIE